jgi:hypothetical protein
LEALARGRKLYQKLGFGDVEDVVVELGKYGGEGFNTTVCMGREVDVILHASSIEQIPYICKI